MRLVNKAILAVVGLIMWLINTFVPMLGSIRSLLNAVVFVVVPFCLLHTFGLIGNIQGVRIARLS